MSDKLQPPVAEAERRAHDALTLLERSMTRMRLGLAACLERTTEEAVSGNIEANLLQALHLANEVHDALTLAAGGETTRWPAPEDDGDVPF